MTDLVLTEDEERQVEEGQAAAALLDSPAFLLAIERVRADCAEGILTSAPHQADERERLYNLSRGLSAVAEELVALAAQAEALIGNATRTTNDDVQAEAPDDPSDTEE